MVMLACLIVACGGPAPSTEPSAQPTPPPSAGPTPVAALTEPATADQVYRALVAAGLKIQANTATGGEGQDPFKVIQASFEGWPLSIGQWSSGKVLREAHFWKPGAKPGRGEPPVQFMGRNILVQWGPVPSGLPKAPTDEQSVVAIRLRNALETLLPPLTARANIPLPGGLPGSTPIPDPTKAPPKATPRPTKK
jgi:hypothetical protein